MTGNQETAAPLRQITLSGPLRRQVVKRRDRFSGGIVAEVAPETTPIARSGGGDTLNPPNAGVPQPVTLSNGGGPIAVGSPVQLIFWGNAWNDPSTSPSAAQLTADVQSILAGPWRAGLRQYGVGRIPFGGAAIVGNWQPPATFSQGDVGSLVLTLIDGGAYVPGELNLYVVMMPPNTNYGPGGVTGQHWAFSYVDPLVGSDPAWVAFVLFNVESTMTGTFSHELAEMLTDPDGGAWQVNPRNSVSWNEIGDVCNFQYAPLAGVTVQAYWSQQDNACLIPQAPSVRKTLALAGITLGGNGLRAVENPIPSLNALIDRLYGSTL